MVLISFSAEIKAQDSWLNIEPIHGDFGLSQERFHTSYRAGSSLTESGYFFNYQSVNLLDRLSIYDPRFIDLNLGAGLKLGQGHGDASGENNEIIRYNLGARILKEHPYNLSLNYIKQTQVYEHSPTSFTNVVYRQSGGTLQFREKIGLPIPIVLSYQSTHRHTDSEFKTAYAAGGIGHQVFRFDNNRKSYQISTSRSWDWLSFIGRYDREEVDNFQLYDLLGATSEYVQTETNTSLSGRLGDEGRLQWFINWDDRVQTEHPRSDRRSLNVHLTLRIYDFHSNSLTSSLGFNRLLSEQGGGVFDEGTDIITTDTRRARIGLNHRLFQSLNTQLNFVREESIFNDFEKYVRESGFSTRYTKKIPKGSVYGGLSIQKREEENTGDQVLFMTDEFHTINDDIAITLDQPHIELASVRITDSTGTVIYVEGQDYLIYRVGIYTQVQRISATTTIPNGGELLVDYSYLNPRGDRIDKTRAYEFGANWWFMEPFYRVTVRDEEIPEAPPEISALLDPGRKVVYGVHLHQLLWDRIYPTFRLEKERNISVQDVYLSTSTNGGLTVYVLTGFNVTVFSERTYTDYDEPGRYSDATAKGLNMHLSRGRITASLDARKRESQIIGTNRVVWENKGELTYFLGQWVLDTSFKKANELWVYNSDPDLEFESEYIELKVNLNRTF